MTSVSNSYRHRSSSKTARRIAGVILLISSVCVAANAQQRAFESIEFGITGGFDVVETTLHDTWSIPAIGEINISTPFYFGEASINATYLPATSKQEDITDFWSIYAGAGIGYPLMFAERFSITPEFRFGSMYMNFADEQVDFRKEESEIFTGFRLSLATRVTASTEVELATMFLHTFTDTPINVSVITAGVRYRVQTPQWLRRVLQ